MTSAADVEKAERIGRSRARLFAVQAILFITWQGTFLIEGPDAAVRTVSIVKLSAWFVWVAALLMLIATGGGLFRHRRLRALLNDEFTRANRAQAYVAGFWAAMITAMGLYLLSLIEPIYTRETIHYILSAAIASALITFAVRERRTPVLR